MEFDTPSRFIRDIDPELLEVSEEKGGAALGGRPERKPFGSSFGGSRRGFASEQPEWMQNPRPVATQFKADPKPRMVAPRQPEKPVDPFGENFKRVYNAVAPRPMVTKPGTGNLQEGMRIEHQRFGIGTVLKIEGTGENTKATVQFVNTGVKQLLLKFAKFKIIS
jgi:DNA helicase-2/ATP-dependent DNA helicase PcrA